MDYTDEKINKVFHQINPKVTNNLDPGRMSIIRNILSGRDTLNILPTGGGKSACYQVPAMLLPGVTLVISPLISLIQDQVLTLRRNHIPVACITGSFIVDRKGPHEFFKNGREKKGSVNSINEEAGEDEEEYSGESRRRIRDDQIFLDTILAQKRPEGVDGEHGYKIIYLTPERLRTAQFLRFSERADISMIAVDEAHCISLWGYDFRRQYLEIPRFMKRIDQRPVIAAFTATATETVRYDIMNHLAMEAPVLYPPVPEGGGYSPISKRDNLSFSVITNHRRQTKDPKKYRRAALCKMCRKKLLDFDAQDKKYCILIYCQTTREVKEYYQYFQEIEAMKDVADRVTYYYGSLREGTKRQNWKDFKDNRKQIMISTNALGMGVDKGNIRTVFHAGIPTSLENYYQEAGRGGRFRSERGRMQAECILYCLEEDEDTCLNLIESSLESSGLNERERGMRRLVAYERLYNMENYCNAYLGFPLYDKEDPFREIFEESDDRHVCADGLPEDPQDYIVTYFNTHNPGMLDPRRDETAREVEKLFQEEAAKIDVLFANRTKISQLIRKGQMAAQDVRVGRRSTPYTVSYEITGGPLSYLDMMAADAVYTLFKHGYQKVYARHVAALLSGDHGITLNPKQTAAITDSLRRMSRARIRIDMGDSTAIGFFYDDEMTLSDDGEKMTPVRVLEGPFLPLAEEKSGFSRIGKQLPPLYEYAEIMNGQMHGFRLPLLKVARYETVKNDEGKEETVPVGRLPQSFENMAMTHYLLRRIDAMARTTPENRKIRDGETGKTVILRSSTTSNIRLATLIEDLDEFFDMKRFEHSSPYGRKIRQIKEKEAVILEHLVQQGYIVRFEPATVIRDGKDTKELIENSIRIIRYDWLEEDSE